MHAGGATSLAENRVTPHIIQGRGRWASATWQIYICKHPVLLQAMLHAWAPAHSHGSMPHWACHTPIHLTALLSTDFTSQGTTSFASAFIFSLVHSMKWTRTRTSWTFLFFCRQISFCIFHSSHCHLILPPPTHSTHNLYRIIGVLWWYKYYVGC